MSDLRKHQEASGLGVRVQTIIVAGETPQEAEGPARLDEALRYAIARIEANPRNVEIVVSVLGWDGGGARTLEEASRKFAVSPDRIKQIVAGAIARMKKAQFVPEVVERSLSLAEEIVPILEVELCEALLNARLCFVRFTCDALVTAAQVLHGQSPVEDISIGTSQALVRAGTVAQIDRLRARCRELVQMRGCLNITDLDEESDRILSTRPSHRFAVALARSAGMFEWLDQESGWFWYVSEAGCGRNPLVTYIRRALAETPRLQLAQLQSDMSRDLQGLTPDLPRNVVAAICKRLLFARLEGALLARLENLLAWEVVKVEATLAKTVRRHGAVHGALSDERIFVGWKLDPPALTSGVLRLHEPVSSLLEGDFELVTMDGYKLGGMQIRQRACWDMRPLWPGPAHGRATRSSSDSTSAGRWRPEFWARTSLLRRCYRRSFRCVRSPETPPTTP